MHSLLNRTMRIQCVAIMVLAIICFCMLSCASEMSTRATRVRLIPVEKLQDIEKQCTFIGNVQGQSYPMVGCLCWWCVARAVAHNNALNELLDNAAEVGATHVFINPGNYPDLRGVAFRCCHCIGSDGKRDTAYCLMKDGTADSAYCQDAKGNVIGMSHCEGATGDTQKHCIDNGGMWIQEIDETACKEKGNAWVPKADDKSSCDAKNGIWYPMAKDQITCEEVKGGKWEINEDVMKRLPESETLLEAPK